MPVTLNNLNSTPRSDTLNALSAVPYLSISPGAGVVNSTVQDLQLLGIQYKIRKVAIAFTAIDSIAGTDLFNLVVGTGTYTSAAASAAPNDNSFDPSATTTVGVNTDIAVGVTPVLGGVGYPTNVATAGMTVFGADVPLNATNVPNIATGTGGYAVLIPTNYDAVYPANIPLTLRVTTTASTGSITGFRVFVIVSPVRLRPAFPGSEAVAPVPGVDF